MSLAEWKTDETGNIAINPLARYETMIAAKMAIAIRLDYLIAGDQIETPSGRLQLVLTPIQAIQLAQDLMSAADRIDLTPGTNPS